MRITFADNTFVDADTIRLTPGNRAFRYGDGLFETLCLLRGKCLFAAKHYQRLQKGMNLLGIEIPAHWSADFFEDILAELSHRNGMQNGRCRISVWREGGGLYTPGKNTAGLLCEFFPIERLPFAQYDLPLRTGIFPDMCKTLDPLSACKTSSALIYVLASRYAQIHALDECIVLNQDGRVADASHSNVIVYSEGTCITPAVGEGGVDGIMKQVLQELAREKKIPFQEAQVTVDMMLAADAVLLTNVIQGIRRVANFEKTKYPIKQISEIDILLHAAKDRCSLVQA